MGASCVARRPRIFSSIRDTAIDRVVQGAGTPGCRVKGICGDVVWMCRGLVERLNDR